MSDDIDIVRGSGNVFRDLGYKEADREQFRALLAAKIIGVLDERELPMRAAQDITGVAAADFSRIRKANLGRFTIDRLMTIPARPGQEVIATCCKPLRSRDRFRQRQDVQHPGAGSRWHQRRQAGSREQFEKLSSVALDLRMVALCCARP